MKIPGIVRKNILGVMLGLVIVATPFLSTIPAQANDNTSISASPSIRSASNGASFTVDLVFNTVTPIRGWQTDVNFDASRVQCTAVTEGSFLRNFAQANGGSTYWIAPQIDNVSGKITNAMCAIMGALGPDNVPLGAAGSGTLCTLTFAAKPSVAGTCNIAPVNVVLSDTNNNLISTIVINAANVGIGNTSISPVMPPPTTQVTPTTTPATTTPITMTPPTTPTPLMKMAQSIESDLVIPIWVPVPNLPQVIPPSPGDIFTKVTSGFSVDPSNLNTTIPSGSIIRYRSDGITEVFDSLGNLIFRARDADAVSLPSPEGFVPATHDLQIPNHSIGAVQGNVTEYYLNNVLVLTEINGDVPTDSSATKSEATPSTTPETTSAPEPAQSTSGTWIESAHQQNIPGVDTFDATWNVPVAPTNGSSSTINYIFNGLQPLGQDNSILQPLQGWDGSYKYWYMTPLADLYGILTYPPTIQVKPGDQLEGLIDFVPNLGEWHISITDYNGINGPVFSDEFVPCDFGPTGYNNGGMLSALVLEGYGISGNNTVCSSINFTAPVLYNAGQTINGTWTGGTDILDFPSLADLSVNLSYSPYDIALITANGLNISGSTSCYPVIAHALGVNPNNQVGVSGPFQSTANGQGLVAYVQQGDSDVGLANLYNGTSNVAMFDRPLTLTEAQMFNSYPITRDGVCMIVNNDVPSNITQLTLLQIKGIYEGVYKGSDGNEYWDAGSVTPSSGPDAGITFPALGGSAHVKIVVYAQDIGSGTRDFLGSTCGFNSSSGFNQNPGDGLYYASNFPLEQSLVSQEGSGYRINSDSAMQTAINSANNGAIGYVSLDFDSGANIRTLKIVDSAGVAWSPGVQNIYANKIVNGQLSGNSCYPLARFLYLVIEPSNIIAPNFISWMQNPNYSNGQDTFYGQTFLTLIPDADAGMHGTIDVRDMGAVGSHVGQTGAPHWIRADVTHDGIIDVRDMGAVGAWVGINVLTIPQQYFFVYPV